MHYINNSIIQCSKHQIIKSPSYNKIFSHFMLIRLSANKSLYMQLSFKITSKLSFKLRITCNTFLNDKLSCGSIHIHSPKCNRLKFPFHEQNVYPCTSKPENSHMRRQSATFIFSTFFIWEC